MDNNEVVCEWVRFAETDFETAKYLFDKMIPKPLEIICYHCEQAAEKLLKAFLIANQVMPPKTHDLIRLCEMCEDIDTSFEEMASSCVSLTKYGIAPRYPYELNIMEGETEKALQGAQTIHLFISDRLNPTSDTVCEHKEKTKPDDSD